MSPATTRRGTIVRRKASAPIVQDPRIAPRAGHHTPLGGSELPSLWPRDQGEPAVGLLHEAVGEVGFATLPSVRDVEPPGQVAGGRRCWPASVCPSAVCAGGGPSATRFSDPVHAGVAKSAPVPPRSTPSMFGRQTHCQALAALFPPTVEDLTAPPRPHAGSEAMLITSLAIARTVRRLHRYPLVGHET